MASRYSSMKALRKTFLVVLVSLSIFWFRFANWFFERYNWPNWKRIVPREASDMPPLDVFTWTSIGLSFLVLAWFYHKERVDLEEIRENRNRLLYLIGQEIYSGMNKCFSFMEHARDTRFDGHIYTIISVSMSPNVLQSFYAIDTSENTKLSEAIRSCYEAFLTINHNILNYPPKTPTWCMTHYIDIIRGYETISSHFNSDKSNEHHARLPILSREREVEIGVLKDRLDIITNELREEILPPGARPTE